MREKDFSLLLLGLLVSKKGCIDEGLEIVEGILVEEALDSYRRGRQVEGLDLGAVTSRL